MVDHCLNCNQKIVNKYCSNCGQIATTHRYSIKHFFLHDFLHGVFHLDKGFFYTIKELFTRPGHSIRDYVEGKRVKHFNFFTFIILIITIGHFVQEYFDFSFVDAIYYSTEGEALTEVEYFSKNYPKIYKFLQIPFFAVSSLLFFKKSEQNFTENLVLNFYKTSAELIILIVLSIVATLFQESTALAFIKMGITFTLLIYSTLFYFQYFSKYEYSKINLLLRSIIASVILPVIIAMITSFIIGMKQGFEG